MKRLFAIVKPTGKRYLVLSQDLLGTPPTVWCYDPDIAYPEDNVIGFLLQQVASFEIEEK